MKTLSSMNTLLLLHKAVAKILSIVEEQKRDSVNDMKTLSSMNTLLQGIKASENKAFAHVKELKDALATQSEASEKALEQSLLAQTEEISIRLKAQTDSIF